MPDRLLLKRRWTDSSFVIKPILEGDQTDEQYSTSGRKYNLKALKKAMKYPSTGNTF